ncbi:MAG: hypothetical protein UU48_C0001G0094 [Candidatus Uhrbacteria bacterium GW2011_GWF2_41_16]|jgi:hypothetical protein|uniref:Uncharacterized protein n=2 Tax=Candidatus Uhriibacteriota TaxID=1752732 RepID=A0A0G0VCY4_9BACT|nr:MAG: hypothetical protein UU31_C0002G0093 [Candidatus Uhrbacteria bacterium GW2011_GWA2_41_10]KKR87800.1 MAG: hypothetical protein UU35_C0001G0081 [Candidatus Uhrbacteria bacterium GW2011_GWC2_41_11]KKR98739.1 MAG: hypothetical protein UU48_C0001G0094 [Candidatus Uhrbacteria bacterium GW2011_GWF2_41_16]HBP00164.1 hypothetical protein [Candidatus Uhrbacteria bacterium]
MVESKGFFCFRMSRTSKDSSTNFWRDGLKIASYCPLCESHSNPMDTRVIGEDEESRLLFIRCHKCANSILTIVLIHKGGMSSVGLVTDLTFEDVLRFRKGRRISTNDVLAMHEWLTSSRFSTWLSSQS